MIFIFSWGTSTRTFSRIGTGDSYSPSNVSMPTHYRYQHTRVIAYYHKPAVEILKPVSLPKTITNSIGMTFVYIEPGTFLRGSPEDENGRFDNERQHEVTLTHGYYLQTTEATQGQWEKIMGNNPAYFQNCGDDCPVEKVSTLDIENFIKKLVLEENEYQYRLPTEAEWEYACRAGTQTAFHVGDLPTRELEKKSKLVKNGWYWGNSSQATHGVALKEPNAWGLYDMHGNVWEWCSDRERPYPFRPVINPTGSTIGRLKIRRGGSFSQFPRFCRAAYRSSWLFDANAQDLGFRLVLEPSVVLNQSDWKMAN
jgi:formylglycine-generating enzyme required for sulfatase activity